MIIFLLIFGVCLYIALAFINLSVNPNMSHQSRINDNWLSTIFMPEEMVMKIILGLLVVILFYFVADFFLSSAKRSSLKRKRDAADKATAGKLTKINP